jgi:hypothetical protein
MTANFAFSHQKKNGEFEKVALLLYPHFKSSFYTNILSQKTYRAKL